MWLLVALLPHLAAAQAVTFEQQIQPLLAKYCYDCHGDKRQKGDLSLQSFKSLAEAQNNRATWERVLHNLSSREMPPPNKPQPTQQERDLVARWIEASVLGCDCTKPDPGRVTLRRLNRNEYNNTIRDLVGVDFKPAADFPADDSGYGFDNIGDVLSLSPMLLEKYLAAAEKILDVAIITHPKTNGPARRFEAEQLPSTAKGGGPYLNFARALNTEGEIHVMVPVPAEGEYILRARAFGQQAGLEPAKMEFRTNGVAVAVFDVTAVDELPGIYEKRLHLPSGEMKLAAAYINNYSDYNTNDPKLRGDRNLIIDYLELIGPAGPQIYPGSHRNLFPKPITDGMDQAAYAEEILRKFARRAYRRTVQDSEIARLMSLYHFARSDGDNFESAVKLALQAVLVSPHFLFRGEIVSTPKNAPAILPIGEHALATRLSYFLWSTMPDEELMALADKGRLRRNLDSRVRRMLLDPKSGAFVEHFVGQWLQIRNLELIQPDPEEFPAFDDALRAAMSRETQLLFQFIMKEDRSILDLLDANFTFVNERLARHYNLPGVAGDQFVRVKLKSPERGGVLTPASILALTSNPTRTSPVKRGKFVLENILGTPPPPPPPEVPELAEEKKEALTGTLRQRMEQHRENPNCATCHARMDPIGFGLENFDGIGAWRDAEGTFPIDPSGELVTGEAFQGVADLKTILIRHKREEFARCLTEKMLTYALGRGLEFYDKCAVDDITRNLRRHNYRFSALIGGIVDSVPFKKTRGAGAGAGEPQPGG